MALRRVDPPSAPTLTARLIARFATTRPARFFARVIGWRLDPILLRLSGGRIASTGVIRTGLLETRGARTGEPRRNAVIYFHDGDDVIIAASHAGASTHPAWFHNLVADPDVTFAGTPMRARLVDDEGERTRLWTMADRVFPAFATYRQEAAGAGRSIPLVVLGTATREPT